ncbi:MAG: UDP-2,3-diacylglucosamine diphosphatase LpxI [Hyphomicrobiales bacterium]|nr:UDP-2,3-diacylglucosamine diphosphatase LpxI [Hyphomicrobiales bacterium]
MPARSPVSPRPSEAAPLGIIAGAGELPLLLARRLKEQKRPVFVLGIRSVTDPAIAHYPHAWCAMTALGRSLRLLKEAGCRELVMIGAVQRPHLEWRKLDWLGMKVMARLLFAPRLGDNRLLRAVVRAYEDAGLRVRPVEAFVPELMAAAGYLGAARADARAKADLRYGMEVVRRLGELDISQAAVVCRGQVLAVEGVEGTDFLLERIARLPAALRGTPKARAGVLVKLPKPRQERRVDLPTLGPQTVRGAARAGLAGIVFAEGGALMLRQAECVRLANKAGMFLFGARTPPR